MRRTNYLENLWQDLRHTIRTLAKSPGFTAVIVLTMALSIGANSAIFSVIEGVLLKALPYGQPGRLVRIFLSSRSYPKFPLNPFDFQDYRTRSRSFESLAAFSRNDVQLSGTGEPVRLASFAITSGYFRVLGVHPALGREFDSKDELPARGHVVILSDQLWRSRFRAQGNVIGQKVTLDSVPYTVVGVMPPGFEHPGNEYHAVAYGETVDAWEPFTFEGNPNNRGSHYIEGIGRLKKGVSAAHAEGELNAVMAQLGREHPQDIGWHVMVIPLQREVVGRSRRLLLVLLGAVGLVLLIACANAANLLLARATARQREIAVRLALGARRSRLARQMLTESVLIALAGAAFGAGIAAGGVKALVALLPADFPRAGDIHLNGIVFAFTFAIALATGILFGFAPALQASRTDLQRTLHEGGRSATSSIGSLRLRNALVVSEVSLACVLLIGAGLMLRSFVNLLETDPGFRPEHVLTAGISLPYTPAYKTAEAAARFYDRLLTNLNALPGVQTAGVGTDLPWTGYDENLGGFNIEGKKPPPHQEFHARFHAASSDYFRAIGIPLVRGRFFNQHDNKDVQQVLIVNESMARRYWPHEDAAGKRVAFSDTPKEKDWMTVVGVVGDVKDTPNSQAAEPAFWWPLLQQPWPFSDMSIVIRADSNPALLADELRSAVGQLDSSLAVADIRLMDRVAGESFSAAKFALFLVGLFAALALTLAGVGTYGVISYSVSQRRHEFGVRMALGAKPSDVLGSVLGQGMRLALFGLAIGVFCGLALQRVLGNLLYEVSAADPATFVGVGLVAMAATALACYLPARRATQADPMTALRAE